MVVAATMEDAAADEAHTPSTVRLQQQASSLFEEVKRAEAASDRARVYSRCFSPQTQGPLRRRKHAATPARRLTADASMCVFVTTSPLKVRKGAELCSPLVTTLPTGSRLRMIDSQRMSDGGQRACVVLADSPSASSVAEAAARPQPLGWVTTRRARLGGRMIKQEHGEGGGAAAGIPHSHRNTIDRDPREDNGGQATHRHWPPTLSELQASGRATTSPSFPATLEQRWPLCFFSSSTGLPGTASSASPMDGVPHAARTALTPATRLNATLHALLHALTRVLPARTCTCRCAVPRRAPASGMRMGRRYGQRRRRGHQLSQSWRERRRWRRWQWQRRWQQQVGRASSPRAHLILGFDAHPARALVGARLA